MGKIPGAPTAPQRGSLHRDLQICCVAVSSSNTDFYLYLPSMPKEINNLGCHKPVIPPKYPTNGGHGVMCKAGACLIFLAGSVSLQAKKKLPWQQMHIQLY